jgi:spermidine synthase
MHVVALGLDQALVELISQNFSSAEYAYTTIPMYPSSQIGFKFVYQGPDHWKKKGEKPQQQSSG